MATGCLLLLAALGTAGCYRILLPAAGKWASRFRVHIEVRQPAPRPVWPLERVFQLEAPPLRLGPLQGLLRKLSVLLLWFCRLFGAPAAASKAEELGALAATTAASPRVSRTSAGAPTGARPAKF